MTPGSRILMFFLNFSLTLFVQHRYMPNSRDLSRDKMTSIQNWINCGMKNEDVEEERRRKGKYNFNVFQW